MRTICVQPPALQVLWFPANQPGQHWPFVSVSLKGNGSIDAIFTVGIEHPEALHELREALLQGLREVEQAIAYVDNPEPETLEATA